MTLCLQQYIRLILNSPAIFTKYSATTLNISLECEILKLLKGLLKKFFKSSKEPQSPMVHEFMFTVFYNEYVYLQIMLKYFIPRFSSFFRKLHFVQHFTWYKNSPKNKICVFFSLNSSV